MTPEEKLRRQLLASRRYYRAVRRPLDDGGSSSVAVPTYATWNPLDKDAGVTLSNGDLYARGSTKSVRATQGKSTGKYTFEITYPASFNSLYAGFGDAGFSLANTVGNIATSASYGISAYTKAGVTSFGTAPATSAVPFMFALDLDAGKAWLCKANVWANSTLGGAFDIDNPVFTWTPTTMFPACTPLNATHDCIANFGASAFTNTVPNGFNSGWYI